MIQTKLVFEEEKPKHHNNKKVHLIKMHGIVTVKNTGLFFNPSTQTYHLMHYFTELIRIHKDGTGYYPRYDILKVLKVSYYSNVSIYQLTDYLGIPRSLVKSKMVEYKDYKHHDYGTRVKITDEQFIESLEKVL